MSDHLAVSTTLADFRRLTADLPPETEIFMEFGNCYEYREVGDFPKFFPASLGVPPALILSGGQEFDEDRYLGARLDAYLENDIGWTLPKKETP